MRTVLFLSLLLLACDRSSDAKGPESAGKPAAKQRQVRPFPVEVQKVATQKVDYTITAVGTVEAFEVVQVTARVAGVVEKVRFVEGERVKLGQVLVEIEPARYQLAVRSARAALEKAQASNADAEAGLARRENAAKDNPGLIPGEEIESFRTKGRTATAEVAAAKVALDTAELNLRDAYVRAPMAGLLQTRTVQTGQYVQPGTVLGTLSRRDPLLLRFQVADRDAPHISAGMPVSFTAGTASYSAKITLVAAAADSTSRMVAVTAEIDDPKKDQLQPGAFARVTIAVGGSPSATVIPQIAVRPSEKGFLAYVVENNVAHERVLELGMRTADGNVEVKSGVSPGDVLVVRGAEALREGAPVAVPGAGRPPKP
jgi:membrane fusion protein, multidrug efflux system